MSGDSDFLLRVVVKDVSAYQRFHREFLGRVESVSSTNSSFALKQVKYFTELPLSNLTNDRRPARHVAPVQPRRPRRKHAKRKM